MKISKLMKKKYSCLKNNGKKTQLFCVIVCVECRTIQMKSLENFAATFIFLFRHVSAVDDVKCPERRHMIFMVFPRIYRLDEQRHLMAKFCTTE